ncbi:MAG: STAS domain-containing protein [Pseudomonadota bacterium]
MHVATEEKSGNLVVTLKDPRLDHAVSSAFRDYLLGLETEGRPLVLDLCHVEFMDSSGLGALVGVRKRLGWSAKIVLASVRSPVYRVFELAKMTGVFTFYTSVDAAISRTSGEDDAWGKGRAMAS